VDHPLAAQVDQSQTGGNTTEAFDVILLDLTLPGRDGLQVLTALRKLGSKSLVLVTTARDGIESRVAGLDLGADDYLVKPFAFGELLARMRAMMRRGATEPHQLHAGDLRIDRIAHTATRSGEPIELTVREFQLLEYLVRHQDEVVPRESLAREVWKENGRSSALDNVIDVHIARLRRKVDLDGLAKLIHTVRGVGFMLSEQAP